MVQETWKFINSGHHDAATNMALDECLLNWHSEGKIPPTLRFYGWSKPSLTIGQFQKTKKTINFDGITKHNADFVRRLTGGSAVLHDDELTYSIVIKESHPQIPQSVTEAYYILSKGVLEGYKELGIDVNYAIPERQMLKDRSAVCFEKTAYYEMIVDGKKISGNAQTRKDGVLLQHGSIPMNINEDMLFDMFKFSSDALRNRQQRSFSKKAISIDSITNQSHTYEMLVDAFLKGFKTGLHIDTEPLVLTDADWQEVSQLANDKYRSNSWNYMLKKERAHIGEANR